MVDIDDALTNGLSYIKRMQRPDGGFDGLASPHPTIFTDARLHPTIFFTALIADCCSQLQTSDELVARAAQYLQRHKGPQWSWNYWQRDASGYQMRGYPDDLDDTACSLAALLCHDPDMVNGEAMGYIGQQLVASETAVGGPYQTWLVAAKDLAKWHDVDVAVNANVAYMLSRLHINLASLEQYLGDCLRAGKLSSSYYLGSIPTIYFIARIQNEAYRQPLERLVRAELATSDDNSPLMNALLLSAACRLGLDRRLTRPLVNKLLATQSNGHWPANGLYVEPVINGQQYYAGSEALTTAFACEALGLYGRQARSPKQSRRPTSVHTPTALQASEQFASGLAAHELRNGYQQALQMLVERDRDGQISTLATRFSRDLGLPLRRQTLCHLDRASINGWMAYTLYDELLDDEPAAADHLSTANIAMRECLDQFGRALPRNHGFQAHVRQALLLVDGANAWERQYSRARYSNGFLCIDALPDYGDHAKLVERSWGHVLATTGVLCARGYDVAGCEVTAWQRFFHHFILARQLHDDAHDWQDDLRAGRLSTVVCLLLQGRELPLRLDVANELPDLRRQFWESTSEVVATMIVDALDEAEKALADCAFIRQPAYYQSLVDRLRGGVDQMRHGRTEAMAFMHSFSGHVGSPTV